MPDQPQTSDVEPLTLEQTGHSCFGDRPEALAERCEAEGLLNCAVTIRGLLEERAALMRVLEADEEGDGHEMIHALRDAWRMMKGRGL